MKYRGGEKMGKQENEKTSQWPKLKIGRWQISTAVLGVLLFISVFIGGFAGSGIGDLTGQISLDTAGQMASGLTGQEAADKTINYINQNLLQGQTTATLKGVEESSGLYNLSLSVDGQEIDGYVSKDGKLFFPQAIDLTKKPAVQESPEGQAAQTEAPKSEKPQVELFVMSHCPYGTQMEKGIIPVVKELGENIDFEVKFVNYAMHGEKELDEQLRQYCVQKDYSDKYLAYLSAFLEEGNSQDALGAIGISDVDIADCVKEADETYKVTELFEDPQKAEWSGRFPPFKIYDLDNKKYGVKGSPTLVINGQTISSGRDAQSLLNTICSAFTDKPEACNTDMASFGTPAPGFGFETQGGSATAAGCGA